MAFERADRGAAASLRSPRFLPVRVDHLRAGRNHSPPSDGPANPADVTCARRGGDRMEMLFAAVHEPTFGTQRA